MRSSHFLQPIHRHLTILQSDNYAELTTIFN